MRRWDATTKCLRQHRLLAPSSVGEKSGWAPPGSMPGPYKLNIRVWPSWTLSGSSGRETTSEPIQVLASSVLVVAGLRASVLADCWPGLLSAPADISLERSLLHLPPPQSAPQIISAMIKLSTLQLWLTGRCHHKSCHSGLRLLNLPKVCR